MLQNYAKETLALSFLITSLLSFGNTGNRVILDAESSININGLVTVYKDVSHNMDIYKLKDASFQQKFQPHSSRQINYGFIHSTIWCKWQVINKSPIPVYLEINNPILDSIEFFVFINDSLVQHNIGGMLLPFKNRDININRICYKIPGDSSKSVLQTMYLKLKSESAVECSLTLSNEQYILYRSRGLSLLFGIYLGIILIMAFYNFVLFFFIRDPAYLYYFLYVLLLAILNCWLKGYGFQYIWFKWPYFNHLGTIIVSFPAIATILFGISFLNIDKNAKKLSYGLYLLIAIFLVSTLTSFFTDIIVCSVIIQSNVLLSGIYLFFIGAFLYYKGLRAARYYLLADGFLLIFAIIYLLTYNNYLPNNSFTDNSLIIGSMLETILFSFALSDKVYQFKQEKESAQLNEINTRRSIQENLEEIINSRTREIEIKNEELKRETQYAGKQKMRRIKSKKNLYSSWIA